MLCRNSSCCFHKKAKFNLPVSRQMQNETTNPYPNNNLSLNLCLLATTQFLVLPVSPPGWSVLILSSLGFPLTDPHPLLASVFPENICTGNEMKFLISDAKLEFPAL